MTISSIVESKCWSYLSALYIFYNILLLIACKCINDAYVSKTEAFNGNQFCDVEPDSSCPDVIHYTHISYDYKFTERSISAEAYKESPNHLGK